MSKQWNLIHPPYNPGQRSKGVAPAGVAQIGLAQGSHVTGAEGGGGDTNYHGIDFTSMKPGYNKAPHGNEVAVNTKCGPGGSRDVRKGGSQGRH